jgi:hypothetical protein
MGPNLLTACVFCAGLLTVRDFPTPPGTSVDIAAAYSTLQRQRLPADAAIDERSDVTAKSTSVGFRWAKLPENGLGAGSPSSEIHLGFAFPNSHDEGTPGRGAAESVVATGAGRYENLLAFGRVRIGPEDSVEFGVEQRRHKVTDILERDGADGSIANLRDMIAEHIDLAIGWRHRWRDTEVSGGLRETLVQGRHTTDNGSISARGKIYGGGLEVRRRAGPWEGAVFAESLSGNLPRDERHAPDYSSHHDSAPAQFQTMGMSLFRDTRLVQIFFSARLERTRLPFDSLAVLGSETAAFDAGYLPDVRTRQTVFDLMLRRRVAPGVWPRFFFRFYRGSDTVRLTDPSGALPDLRFDVRRGHQFPPVGANPTAPEYVIGIGVEFHPYGA